MLQTSALVVVTKPWYSPSESGHVNGSVGVGLTGQPHLLVVRRRTRTVKWARKGRRVTAGVKLLVLPLAVRAA